MSIEEILDACIGFDDGVIRLGLDAEFISIDEPQDIVNGYQLPRTSCKISFNVLVNGISYSYGKVFIESIDYKKYINLWVNLYEYNDIFTKRIISIIERKIDTKSIYIPTNPKDEEYHMVLESIGYIHQKDYIYPDVKLYYKEMK